MKTSLVSTNICQQYDITNNTIITKTNLPINVSCPCLFTDNLTGEIYIVGGMIWNLTRGQSNND